MTAKTPDEWLNWYQERTGCKDLSLHPDELVMFHPEHGFITYLVHDDKFALHHLCGDGKFWFAVIKKIARLENIHTLRAFTRRNPKAWMRKYGGHITGYEMEAKIDEIKV